MLSRFAMAYLLVIFIVAAVALHIMEYFLKKGRQVIALANVIFHAAAVFAFLFLQLTFTDFFLFLLCSLIVALLLKTREWKNGI